MKSFVNYQKRSVQLPKGCKDLIEVLQPQKQTTKEPPKSIWEMMPISDRVQERGLAHIQRYVSRLWESTAVTRVLVIAPLGGQAGLVLMHQEGLLNVTVYVDCKTSFAEESAVRAFLAERRIHPTLDYLSDGGEAAQSIRVLRYPLPSDQADAASLTAELGRR